MSSSTHDTHLQTAYYQDTASEYANMHMHENAEHDMALSFMVSALRFHRIQSVLDVGAGTGRVALALKKECPEVRVLSVEPNAALREEGYRQGLSREEMRDGDATKLPFSDGQFDWVCEFGALHHIRQPDRAVAEMLRVAKRGIFISDSNNFGQGSPWARALKQTANAFGLWPLLDWIKTKGKGYTFTEGDGLAYSYSVFNNYAQIKNACRTVHVLNTMAAGINPYRTAPHVALLGVK